MFNLLENSLVCQVYNVSLGKGGAGVLKLAVV